MQPPHVGDLMNRSEMIRSKWVFILVIFASTSCGTNKKLAPTLPAAPSNHSTSTGNPDTSGNSTSSGGNNSTNNNTGGNSSDSDPGLPATSPNVIYATGWSVMIIHANYAKTTIDSGAHLTTDRNACGKDAYAAIALDEWNNFSKNVNLAIQKPPVQDEYCVSPPTDTYKYMDGSVKITTDHGERLLYETVDYQICSTISDHKLSDTLLALINQLILDADKTNCPNGWGSDTILPRRNHT